MQILELFGHLISEILGEKTVKGLKLTKNVKNGISYFSKILSLKPLRNP